MNDRTAKSIFKMIFAAIAFAVMATFVKIASETLPAIEVVFFRSFFGSAMIILIMWKEKASWIGDNPKILMLRGVFGFAALSLNFYAISQLDLGTAVILNYTAPIFVVIFARIILKEKTSRNVSIAILCSFVGLYLLVGPQFQAKPVPILIAILSGVCAALAYVFIRFNSENESPYTIIFYFSVISTIGSVPLLHFGFHWPNAHEWLALAGVTIGAFMGQVWLTKSIQESPVSFVMPFSYLTPVFCAIASVIIWKEVWGIRAAIGGAIIVASGVAIYLFREKTRTSFVPIEE